MNVRVIITEHKNKMIKIIDGFEDYYQWNYLQWDVRELASSHKILGILILTFKKIESMEKSIEYFEENDLMETFQLELEEVKIITEFYYEKLVIKKEA